MKEGKKGRHVDWDTVRARMDAGREALERGWSPEGAAKKRILKERAAALAAPQEEAAPGERIEVVEFVRAGETYAVESRYVREVYPMEGYTPVPCTPPFVMGIVNVRGEVVSVVDVRRFLNLPGGTPGEAGRVVILSSGDMDFGVAADAVTGLASVPADAVKPPPPTFTGQAREYLKGVTPGGTALLDGKAMLGDGKIVVNEFV